MYDVVGLGPIYADRRAADRPPSGRHPSSRLTVHCIRVRRRRARLTRLRLRYAASAGQIVDTAASHTVAATARPRRPTYGRTAAAAAAAAASRCRRCSCCPHCCWRPRLCSCWWPSTVYTRHPTSPCPYTATWPVAQRPAAHSRSTRSVVVEGRRIKNQTIGGARFSGGPRRNIAIRQWSGFYK